MESQPHPVESQHEDQAQQLEKKDSYEVLDRKTLMLDGVKTPRRDLHQDEIFNMQNKFEEISDQNELETFLKNALKDREKQRESAVQTSYEQFRKVGIEVSEEDFKHLCGPLIHLLDMQSQQLDETFVKYGDIKNRMISQEKFVQRLSKENDNYIEMCSDKSGWEQYERLLSRQKRANRKLLNMLSNVSKEVIYEQGSQNTYIQFLEKNTDSFHDPPQDESYFPRRKPGGSY